MIYIVVNKHRVRSNTKLSAARKTERLPVFRISEGKYGPAHYAHSLDILEPCTLVYNPEQPMSCGASVWIETAKIIEKEGS